MSQQRPATLCGGACGGVGMLQWGRRCAWLVSVAVINSPLRYDNLGPVAVWPLRGAVQSSPAPPNF